MTLTLRTWYLWYSARFPIYWSRKDLMSISLLKKALEALVASESDMDAFWLSKATTFCFEFVLLD